MLEFAGPLVSKRGFDPQYASVFDRYAASTRSLLDMFIRFSFNTKFGNKIRPATQNTQRVEISIRNATRRKCSGSGPLRFVAFFRGQIWDENVALQRPVLSKLSHYQIQPPPPSQGFIKSSFINLHLLKAEGIYQISDLGPFPCVFLAKLTGIVKVQTF